MISSVGIILPTYNEEGNIVKVLEEILSKINTADKILVVDGGSTDKTEEFVRQFAKDHTQISLIQQGQKLGLRSAYIEGFSFYQYNPSVSHILMMDADLSHSPNDIKTLTTSANSVDVVIGSRNPEKSFMYQKKIHRNLLSVCSNIYLRLILQMPITDITSGFILFDKKLLPSPLSILSMTRGYIFQAHLKYIFWKRGATMKEVAIEFNPRQSGRSKMSFRIMVEGLYMAWKIRFTSLR